MCCRIVMKIKIQHRKGVKKMSTVLYEVKGNIAILTISREKALNALNSEVLNDLDAARE